MLSVILADDEPVILRGLTKLIDWEKLGLTLIGEAHKGDDLLKAIIEHTPDIVITDISMPGMTGIDVLKQLKKLGIQSKVIFISAYREFSYAQDALSYGAVDYLIKPIDRKKLVQILLKTVTDISEVSKMDINNSRLQQYEVKQKRQTIVDFLEKLTEENKLSNIPDMVHELAGDDPNVRFSVIAVEADHNSKHTGSWLPGERKLLYFAIQNIMEELIPSEAAGWAISNRSYLYMVLKHNKALNIDELASQFHKNIGQFLKLSITIGIGTLRTLERIPESYSEAKNCVSYKFFLGTNRLISYSSIPSSLVRKGTDRDKIEKELFKDLVSMHNEFPSSLLDDWLETVKVLSWGNRDYTVNLCNAMLIRALRELSPAGFEIESEELRFTQQLNEYETYHEVSSFIYNELKLLQMKVHNKGGSKDSGLIIQMKTYIDEHYEDEINLETMATRFYMNPYYFSNFFKKQTGQNFKQYVTEVRMKYALEMLNQTDDMFYEIAEKVGYHNARQFSEIFKKYYGMLPNEYRRSLE
jgi:two-component system response regulator YesN